MKSRVKIFPKLLVLLSGIVILNIATSIYFEIFISNGIARIGQEELIKLASASALFVIFGMLIEWQRLIKVFSKKINIDKALLPLSVLLAIIAIIPSYQWISWLGYWTYRTLPGLFIGPVQSAYIQNVLSVLAGILLVRSLTKPEDTDREDSGKR